MRHFLLKLFGMAGYVEDLQRSNESLNCQMKALLGQLTEHKENEKKLYAYNLELQTAVENRDVTIKKLTDDIDQVRQSACLNSDIIKTLTDKVQMLKSKLNAANGRCGAYKQQLQKYEAEDNKHTN